MSTETDNLYERAGGAPGVARLVGIFYQRVLSDPELAPFFAHTPMDKLRHMQTEFFTSALGGPVTYSGQPLAHVHQGRGIRPEHIRQFIGHLLATLETLELSRRDVQHIYERIAIDAGQIATDESGACEAG